MKSSTRLALLKRRYALLAVPFFGVANASQAEVNEEASRFTNGQHVETYSEQEIDDSFEVANEAPEVIRNAFDKPDTSEGSHILSASERAQVASELARLRKERESKALAQRIQFAIVLRQVDAVVARPNSEADLREFAELSTYAQG